MSKKVIALLLCLCMMASMLAACGGQQETQQATQQATQPGQTTATEPAETEKATEPEAPAKQHVELLRIGTTYKSDSFSIYSGFNAGALGRMNYTGFTNLNFWDFDENNQISTDGCFFRSWEISEDNTQLTVTYDLDGMNWHDGVPVSDEDVLFTFEFWKAQKYPLFLHITDLKLVESGKVVVTFDTDMAFSFVNQGSQGMVAKHIWENIENPAEYNGEGCTIGCGPFKFVGADADAQVSYYEAVENYPLGEVTVDKVELYSFDNQASLAQALLNDDIDVMYGYSSGLDATLVPMLTNDPNIDLGQSQNSATYQMMFGFNQYPTDQLPIRQAVSYALDYELLRDTLAGAYGEVTSTGAVSPVCLGYDDSLPKNARDIAKGNQVLEDAGYLDVDGDGFRELPDGTEMSIRIGLQSANDLYKRNAEILQTNLAEVGIRAVVDEETISNADYRTAQRMNGEYELWLSMTTSGMAQWGGVAKYAAAVTITSGQRFGTYADPEYLAAYDAMEKSTNYDEYVKAFTEIQRMNSEDIPVIAFAVMSIFYPYRTDTITGWTNYPARGVINTSTWYTAVAK